LRIIVDAPWYVPNSLIRRDLSCPTVKEQIRRYSSHYGDRYMVRPKLCDKEWGLHQVLPTVAVFRQEGGSRTILKCILKNYRVLRSTKQVVIAVISRTRTQETVY
jgi:hypothetical protein